MLYSVFTSVRRPPKWWSNIWQHLQPKEHGLLCNQQCQSLKWSSTDHPQFCCAYHPAELFARDNIVPWKKHAEIASETIFWSIQSAAYSWLNQWTPQFPLPSKTTLSLIKVLTLHREQIPLCMVLPYGSLKKNGYPQNLMVDHQHFLIKWENIGDKSPKVQVHTPKIIMSVTNIKSNSIKYIIPSYI